MQELGYAFYTGKSCVKIGIRLRLSCNEYILIYNYRKGNYMKKTNDNFIMLPTVDICFKNLMDHPDVRKGFIAALLRCSPNEISKTTLLPTTLKREYGNDKLGILDVLVLLQNGTQINMEMQVAYFDYWNARVLFYLGKTFTGQLKKGDSYEELKKCVHVSILDFIHFTDDDVCCRRISFCDEKTGKKYTDLMEIQILELKKLPQKMQDEEEIISWMRFFGGKSREEFEDMAKTNEYIGIAYEELQKLSADELKRLDYEAREKAVRDYNSQMRSALRRGARGKLKEQTRKKLEKGMNIDAIAEILEEDTDTIQELADEIEKEKTSSQKKTGEGISGE